MRMLGDVMALNTIINEQRELVFVSYGDIIESHDAAVRFVRDWIQVPVPRRFKPSSHRPRDFRSTRPTTRPSKAW